MKPWHRLVPWLVAASMLALSACVIGPKHDDPLSDEVPPARDASVDTLGGAADTSSPFDEGVTDSGIAALDSSPKVDGDGSDGGVPDGDAAEAPADADAMDGADGETAPASDAADAG